MKIDLHCHSHYSDGTLSPQELIMRAHNMQVDVLAITDHDTVEGVNEAVAFQATQSRPLRLIAGTEISTSWHGFDIHILGLNVDHHDSVLLERLDKQSERRRQRAIRLAEKLAKAGIPDCYEQAVQLSGKGQITRAHFARVLVERGIVSQPQQAFTRYLGKGKRAYVTSKWISVADAVNWIRDAGGSAVLAHPAHYDMTTKWLRRLLKDFSEAGGHGMEVCHPGLSPDKQRLLAQLANEHGLAGSQGSDFHFPGRWTELGRTSGFPESLVPVWQDWTLSVA